MTPQDKKSSTSSTPLTSSQRAEKITPCWQPTTKDCLCPMHVIRPVIAAQIEEAEREAYDEANKDFNWLQSAVAQVYCAMTDNKMSKWNYEPEAVIAEMEDTQNRFFEKEIEQARLEGFSAAREKAKGITQAYADVGREIANEIAKMEPGE